jgi:hypothetical protein
VLTTTLHQTFRWNVKHISVLLFYPTDVPTEHGGVFDKC